MTTNQRALVILICIALFMVLVPSVTFAEDEIRVTGIRLNQTELIMTPGEQQQLLATVYPTNATDRRVAWHNSNPAVVSIAVSGRNVTINAHAAGDAVITATTRDKGYIISCFVTVITPVRSIGIDRETITLNPGDTHLLQAWVEPRDATDQGLIWESSDHAVAMVDQEGKVKAVRAGETRIIARANEDDSISTYAKIVVVNAGAISSGETEETTNNDNDETTVSEVISNAETENNDTINYLLWLLIAALLIALVIFLYIFILLPRKSASAIKPGTAVISGVGMPVLVGLSGLYSGQKFALNAGPVIIGRDPAVARVVYPQDHNQISRRHCTIYFDQKLQQFIIEDTSSNGTFLADGQKLQPNQQYFLQPGESITLAQSGETFAVELE